MVLQRRYYSPVAESVLSFNFSNANRHITYTPPKFQNISPPRLLQRRVHLPELSTHIHHTHGCIINRISFDYEVYLGNFCSSGFKCAWNVRAKLAFVADQNTDNIGAIGFYGCYKIEWIIVLRFTSIIYC